MIVEALRRPDLSDTNPGDSDIWNTRPSLFAKTTTIDRWEAGTLILDKQSLTPLTPYQLDFMSTHSQKAAEMIVSYIRGHTDQFPGFAIRDVPLLERILDLWEAMYTAEEGAAYPSYEPMDVLNMTLRPEERKVRESSGEKMAKLTTRFNEFADSSGIRLVYAAPVLGSLSRGFSNHRLRLEFRDRAMTDRVKTLLNFPSINP